jgi:hypothetical protein
MSHGLVTPHCVGSGEGFIRWAAVCAVCSRPIIYTARGSLDEPFTQVCCGVPCATVFAETLLMELGG